MRWRACPACDARWWGKIQTPCWACGRAGRAVDAFAPDLTSQNGFGPPIGDHPALEERDTEL